MSNRLAANAVTGEDEGHTRTPLRQSERTPDYSTAG
jgi:hypothetical protein